MNIECKNLTKTYHQGDITVTAVDSCSITVEAGDFAVLLGVSGSGKTTLLNMLGLLSSPTSGQLLFDGKTVPDADQKQSDFRLRHMGFVRQSFDLLPILTAEENIVLPRVIAGKKTDAKELKMLTDLLGIGDRLHFLPPQLSGGQKQRVAIARALMGHPDILLCDEPTGSLDKASAHDFMKLLLRVRQERKLTVIMVTHDTCLADYADSVYEMTGGTVIRQNTIPKFP